MGVFILILAACEPTATPLPVELPATATGIAPEATPAPLRIALGANTVNWVVDLDLLQAEAAVDVGVTLNPASLGEQYDILAQYGQHDGWLQSPIVPHVALVIGKIDADLADILKRSIDTAALTDALGIPGAIPQNIASVDVQQLRAEMANLGRPDGFGIAAGYTAVPGVEIVITQLERVNINTRTSPQPVEILQSTLESGETQLGFFIWTTPEIRRVWETRFGLENIIDLFALPISYLAVDGLNVEFTPGGWPISRR
jgi:hypothetical protein